MSKKDRGDYSRSFITNTPANLDSEEAKFYKKNIPKYPDEGIYIYNFRLGKMIYADGWEDVIGKPSNELGMVDVIDFTAPKFVPFVEEVNDKALEFLHIRSHDLTKYSFSIEIKIKHKNDSEIPIFAWVSVHSCTKDGYLESIMGRFQINRGLRFGKVMRYAAYGPEKGEFINALDSSLFKALVISQKEREALALVAEGYALKQIAALLNVSQSAIEKRIKPLKKRYGVQSLPQLVYFAQQNFLLD